MGFACLLNVRERGIDIDTGWLLKLFQLKMSYLAYVQLYAFHALSSLIMQVPVYTTVLRIQHMYKPEVDHELVE